MPRITTPRLSVIIPYFQREPGILGRAVRSILSQSIAEPIGIVIVDDESPVPADAELAGLAPSPSHRITVIRQTNAGPAIARNAGLDRVDTEYVAFLDSDDVWSGDHLANGVAALDLGHDLYFADFLYVGKCRTRFQETGLDGSGHAPLGAGAGLFRYRGDLFDALIADPPIGTSTVVYRVTAFGGVRMPATMRYAGEDRYFWMDLARKTDRVAFSTCCEAEYGRGVNIFSNAQWGTRQIFARLSDEMRFQNAVRRGFSLTASQRRTLGRTADELTKEMTFNLIHSLANRKSPDWPAIRSFYSQHPPGVPKSLWFSLRYLSKALGGRIA